MAAEIRNNPILEPIESSTASLSAAQLRSSQPSDLIQQRQLNLDSNRDDFIPETVPGIQDTTEIAQLAYPRGGQIPSNAGYMPPVRSSGSSHSRDNSPDVDHRELGEELGKKLERVLPDNISVEVESYNTESYPQSDGSGFNQISLPTAIVLTDEKTGAKLRINLQNENRSDLQGLSLSDQETQDFERRVDDFMHRLDDKSYREGLRDFLVDATSIAGQRQQDRQTHLMYDENTKDYTHPVEFSGNMELDIYIGPDQNNDRIYANYTTAARPGYHTWGNTSTFNGPVPAPSTD